MIPVIIRIQAIHEIEDPDVAAEGFFEAAEKIENWHQGSVYQKNKVTYIEYIDEELDAEASENASNNQSIIKLEADKVTIIRYGPVQSRQTFVEGAQDSSDYITAYGKVPLTIATNKVITNFVRLDSGFIQIEYTLDIGGARIGTRIIDISVMPANQRRTVAEQ